MPPARIKYMHPKTGENMTAPAWAKKLGISRNHFYHRIKRHGLSPKAFEYNRLIAKSSWASWEDDFLRETYEDDNWTVPVISKKLSRTPHIVRARASYLGLKSNGVRTPAHNWLHIWRMREEGLSTRAIARVLGANHATVLHALKKMDAMGEDERQQRWMVCGYFDKSSAA